MVPAVPLRAKHPIETMTWRNPVKFTVRRSGCGKAMQAVGMVNDHGVACPSAAIRWANARRTGGEKARAPETVLIPGAVHRYILT